MRTQTPSTAKRVIITSIRSPRSIISSPCRTFEAYPIVIQVNQPIGRSMEKYPDEERCNPYKRYDGDPLSTYCIVVKHIQIYARNGLFDGEYHQSEEGPVRETLYDPQWEHGHLHQPSGFIMIVMKSS